MVLTLRHPKMHSNTKFGIPTKKNIGNIPESMPILEKWIRGQSHSDLRIVRDITSSQDEFIHGIWNSYHKEYRRYAPDSIPILETRSEVKVKVTQGWYVALRHPKMHAHTNFGILNVA